MKTVVKNLKTSWNGLEIEDRFLCFFFILILCLIAFVVVHDVRRDKSKDRKYESFQVFVSEGGEQEVREKIDDFLSPPDPRWGDSEKIVRLYSTKEGVVGRVIIIPKIGEPIEE